MQQQSGVICHIFDDIGFNGIFSCAVSVFFFISGFLFTKNLEIQRWGGYVQTVWKRVITLGIPYVLWNIIYAVFIRITEHEAFPGPLALFGLNRFFPAHHALWYVKFLFIFFLVSPMLMLFVRVLRTFPKLEIACGLAIIIGFSVNHSGTLVGFAFYSLGLWLGFNYDRVSHFLDQHACKLLIIFGGLTLSLLVARLAHTFFWGHCAKFLKYQTVATAAMTSWFLADFTEGVVRRKWFAWLVPFAFFVYCSHFVITCLARDFIWQRFPPLVAPFVVTGLSAVFSVALGASLRRCCPRLYWVLSGGR